MSRPRVWALPDDRLAIRAALPGCWLLVDSAGRMAIAHGDLADEAVELHPAAAPRSAPANAAADARRWLDDVLVERAAAWLHSWPGGGYSDVPWAAAGEARREQLRTQARGVLQLADGTMISFLGDPGPVPEAGR